MAEGSQAGPPSVGPRPNVDELSGAGLRRVAELLGRHDTEVDLAEALCHSARLAVRADRAWLLGAAGNRPIGTSGQGPSDDRSDAPGLVDPSVVQRLLNADDAIDLGPAAGDGWAGPLIGVPVEIRAGRRLALIAGREADAAPFTDDDLEALTRWVGVVSLLAVAAGHTTDAGTDEADRGGATPLADLPEEYLIDMLESAPDAMLMADSHGRMVVVNQQAETMFGYDRADLLGRPIEDLLPDRHREIHLKHRAAYQSNPVWRPMGIALDLWALRSDGTEFPVDVALSPAGRPGSEGHIIAAVRDVTSRSETEARLREVQIRFRGAFDDGPVPMALVDIAPPADRVIIEANQAMADLLGYSTDELIGMSFIELTHPDDRRRDDAAVQDLASGQVDQYAPTKRYVRADGSTVWVQLHASSLVRRDGGVLGIAHAIDITEQLEIMAVAERHEALNEAVSEVRLAMLRGASRDQGLGLIARSSAECLEADTTVILTRPDDDEQLTIAASHQLPADEAARLRFNTSEGVVGEVFQSGRAQICGPDDPRYTDINRAVVDSRPVGSIIIAPLHDGEATAGILIVVRNAGVSGLGTSDLAAIERFASEAVIAIELAAVAETHQRLEILEDRERIGRDMHDKVIGRLFATGMNLQAMATLLDDGYRDRALAAVTELDAAIQEIRATIYGIRSQVDWGKGARGEILAVAAAQRTALGFEPEVHLDGEFDDLPHGVIDDLLATLREALSNVSKYAEATAVSISVVASDDTLALTVTDDGIGFKTGDESGDEASPLTHHGLVNMVARAERLGGRTNITSSPEDGTTIRWQVPNGRGR